MNVEIIIEEDNDSTATPVTGSKIRESPWTNAWGKGGDTKGKKYTTLTAPNFCKYVAFFNVRLEFPPSQKTIDKEIRMCQTLQKKYRMRINLLS